MWNGRGERLALLIGLVMLAHWLFLEQSIGVSVAFFGLAIMAAVIWLRSGGLTRIDLGVVCGVAMALLPVAEKAQALSLAFAVAGVALGVAAIWLGPALRDRWIMSAAQMLATAPVRGPVDLWAARGKTTMPRIDWRPWLMPLVVAAVFGGLMISGNPVLEDWAARLTTWDIDPGTILFRLAFWWAMAMAIWPLLRAADHSSFTLPDVQLPLAALGFNGASVARALVLFNAMFAVQTCLDATYLWGGAPLRESVSHAAYAHRGAYPLLATALLAGVFALASRPYLGQGRVLRALLILWLVQNVLLVVSSLLRLDLYVGEYGLTYLRIAAGIWMGLVAVGLGLTAWQVWAARSNGWLIGVNAGVGVAVLYVCCFVNFAALIADDGRARIAAGQRVDMDYICALGPDAAGHLPMRCGGVDLPVIAGWRDWGFRAARIRGRFPGMMEPGR